jgi:hypothetical protein
MILIENSTFPLQKPVLLKLLCHPPYDTVAKAEVGAINLEPFSSSH